MTITHLVASPSVAAFQHRPKGFDALHVYLPVNIRIDTVFQSIMTERQIMKSGSIVVVDFCFWGRVSCYESLQGACFGIPYNCGVYLTSLLPLTPATIALPIIPRSETAETGSNT